MTESRLQDHYVYYLPKDSSRNGDNLYMDSRELIKGIPLSVEFINYLTREMIPHFQEEERKYIEDLLALTERRDPSPEIVQELCTSLMLHLGLYASSRWPEENEIAFKALSSASKFCEKRCEPRDGDLDI